MHAFPDEYTAAPRRCAVVPLLTADAPVNVDENLPELLVGLLCVEFTMGRRARDGAHTPWVSLTSGSCEHAAARVFTQGRCFHEVVRTRVRSGFWRLLLQVVCCCCCCLCC